MTDAKKMELADRLWGYAADCDTDGMPEQANDLRTASTTLRTAPNQLTAGTTMLELAPEILDTMRHARVFIVSREKMHPTGVELYDELYKKIGAAQMAAERELDKNEYQDAMLRPIFEAREAAETGSEGEIQRKVPSSAASALTAGTGVREALEALIAVAHAAFDLADNSETTGLRAADEVVSIETGDFHKLSGALDRLDNLPDDQPGVTMSGPAKAEWALRIALPPAQPSSDMTEHIMFECPECGVDLADESHQPTCTGSWRIPSKPAPPPLDPATIEAAEGELIEFFNIHGDSNTIELVQLLRSNFSIRALGGRT
jgi:hypothetical protein